jgi:anti-sigma factor RsiW
MTRTIDQGLRDQLSAYLDGALSPADTLAVELLVENDAVVAAEFEALSRVDQLTKSAFDTMLADPVPMALARAIERSPLGDSPAPQLQAANLPNRPVWQSIAAALALLLVGGAGGAFLSGGLSPAPQQVASAMGWLDQVADYHLVYAAQKRHLVEVPASETEHLQQWLSETTGVSFTVPDLSASGLTFQGARLLVASGKPVAQLLYTDAADQVVALCFLSGGDASAAGGHTTPTLRTAKGVNMVWWKSDHASYVVVGPTTGVDLQSVAEAAAIAL